MKRTPIRPPAMARRVICAHAGFMPQMNRAGMVKSTPDATDELASDRVYEFAFIGGSLKLRGSDAAPMRPIAIPLRDTATGGAS